MKGVTDTKGLGNIPTATSKRLRARPPQHGTAHLEMYLLSAEKQRLEQELAHLDERRGRIQERLKGSAAQLLRLQQVAQQEEAQAGDGSVETSADPVDGNGRAAAPESTRRQWKTMPLDY